MAKKEHLAELVLGPRRPGVPLFRWLYDELRLAILSGRIKPGTRLPSTRVLARHYRVARGTAVDVFEQLATEGYIGSRVGAGSIVRQSLPDQYFRADPLQEVPLAPPSGASLSRRGRRLASSSPLADRNEGAVRAFQANHPAVDHFPTESWSRIAARRLRRATRSLLMTGDALGFRPLREAIAAQVGIARGINCSADQVVITTGTQQSMDLIGRLVLDDGDRVWVEDPGYPGAVSLFRALGAEVCGIPVDEEGIDCAAGARRYKTAKLVYVTPAHQCPLGVGLSATRRLELLRWAGKTDAWIFEDDYDGEFRFSGRPLAALQSLDTSGCVIYASSYSKMLFPTLRLGYMILPPRLIEPLTAVRALIDRYPPVLEQAILCDFMTEGHFAHHVRRMRELYASRLDLLEKRGRVELQGLMRLTAIPAGLQVVGWLEKNLNDAAVADALAKRDIEVGALSRFTLNRSLPPGLILGFASPSERALRAGVQEMAKVLRSMAPRGKKVL